MRAEKKRSAGAPIGIFISHTPLHTLRPYEPLYKGGASCVCVLGEGGADLSAASRAQSQLLGLGGASLSVHTMVGAAHARVAIVWPVRTSHSTRCCQL